MKRKAYGFTLVELAITIAIIAILAVISVVAYNGIQKRAQTAAYVSAVDGVEKTLSTAIIHDRTLSTTPAMGPGGQMNHYEAVCIGTLADLPATNEFAAGECMKSTENGAVVETYRIDEAFLAKLNSLEPDFSVGSLPTVRYTHNGATVISRGVIGTVMSLGGNETWLVLYWMSPDRSSCGRGGELIGAILGMLYEIRDGQRPLSEAESLGITTMEQLAERIAQYEQMPGYCLHGRML